jgi:hypothetical protein
LWGPGSVKPYASATHETPPDYRKSNTAAWRSRQPFEDEHLAHATIDGVPMYYTAFSSGCMIDGREVYAVRVGYEHSSNFAYKSGVQLYVFDRTGNPAFTKTLIYTTAANVDVRDVNVCPHPSRAGFVLVSFAELTSGGAYQARLITYNMRTAAIESNRLLLGMTSTDFKWGNALVTPQGFLLFCSYSLDGTTIKVWKSTVALPTSGDVTMEVASTLTDTVASEPTIGYWQDKLVLFYRRTGAASRLTYSFDKEGAGPWAATVFPYGVSAHSPAVLPYSNAPVFTAFFALGTNRAFMGACSSNDLTNFKGMASIQVTGGKTGGYPAIIDCGGYYATCTYSEHYDEAGQPKRTRFDRLEIDKGRVDIGPADPERTAILSLPAAAPEAGAWIGTPYGADAKQATDARNYASELIVSKAVTIDRVSMMVSGTANAQVEVYEDGVLVATSNVLALATATPTAAVFVRPSSLALVTLKKYRFRLVGSAAVALYDLRHNTRGRAVVRVGVVDMIGAYNPTPASIAATSAVTVAMRLAL